MAVVGGIADLKTGSIQDLFGPFMARTVSKALKILRPVLAESIEPRMLP